VASVNPALSYQAGNQRTLVTPEGVDLRIRLAIAGQRAGAFIIDFLLLITCLVLLTLVLAFAGIGTAASGSEDGVQLVFIVWMLGVFLLRNFYFIAFEMGRRSATLGKRMTGLRVVARDGGRLTADAVIARNLMRELEIYLPLGLLFGGEETNGLVALAGFAWAALFLFFPLFNKDRLRAGDIIAGTWVVHAPQRKLEADLADSDDDRRNRFAFTDAQLDAYGEYELQTLETVLRSGNADTQQSVANTIRGKIGWHYDDHDHDFLSAYYAALGARLERGMLFGKRRLDKFDCRKKPRFFEGQGRFIYGEAFDDSHHNILGKALPPGNIIDQRKEGHPGLQGVTAGLELPTHPTKSNQKFELPGSIYQSRLLEVSRNGSRTIAPTYGENPLLLRV